MRTGIIIIAIVFLFTYLFYKYYKITDLLYYKFRVVSIKSDNWTALLTGIFSGSQKITVEYELDITNKSDANLAFSDLNLEFWYKGRMIAVTPLYSEVMKETIFEKGKSTVYRGIVDVKLNSDIANLAIALYNGKTERIEFKAKFKATKLGIPVSFAGNYDYKL